LWRILDCKEAACREIVAGAPDYFSAYSAESQEYFNRVLASLDALGVKYQVDRQLVRGLDYYVHTVWEVTHDGLGGQNAIAGGGRYELFLPDQNKPVRGVGFAAGMERLMLVQDALQTAQVDPEEAPVFLGSLGTAARLENLKLAAELRHSGRRVALEVEDKSMKAQMRSANRAGAVTVVIRGEEELARGVAVVKNMAGGEQQEVPLTDLINKL
jgi:histidyl-tRNA synthetase